MAKIVVVHGIGQQTTGPNTLHARLFPALGDGVALAGQVVEPDAVAFASYGQLFRPDSEFLSPAPYYDAADIKAGFEADFLVALWQRAAQTDPAVVPPEEEVLSRTPSVARRALAALSKSRFLTGVAERAFIGDLKQVSAYLGDNTVRETVQNKVSADITADTRVVVGHSLGSVVAYEILAAGKCPGVRALITLGSPLGLRKLVFERLRPAPEIAEGNRLIGVWPHVQSWANVADTGDIVAAVEDLRPLFGDELRQLRVHNGAHAHDMSSYLTDRGTGELIAAGLAS